MRWLRIALVALIFTAPSVAGAASVPLLSGPWDPGVAQLTINNVIANINAILSPLTGSTPGNAPAVNLIGFTPGTTGAPAVVSVQPGGDASASLQILPDPGGNIILFGSGSAGSKLVFANPTIWVSAPSLTVCPGANGMGGAMLQAGGGNPTVAGYWVFEDWLNRTHFTPGC